MKEYEDDSYLLLIENLISLEEKKQIEAEIDRGFLSSFDSKDNNINVPSVSSGLFFPLIVTLAVIVFTSLFILFFIRNYSVSIESAEIVESLSVSEAEWEILKRYKDETDLEIKTKEIEIHTYKARIEDYDRRLKSVKEIISFKRDFEVLLNAERENLESEGYSSDEIRVKLADFENEKISGFAPELAEDYILSIDELNSRIDSILDAKTANEQKLNQIVEERDQMVVTSEKLTSEMGDTSKLEKQLSEIEDLRIQQAAFIGWGQQMFVNAFQKIEEGNYKRAEELIDSMLDILNEEFSPGNSFLDTDTLSVQIKTLEYLKLYTETFTKEDSQLIDEDYLKLSEFLKNNLNGFSSSTERLEREEYENDLKDVFFTIPELGEAYNFLLSIEQEKWEMNNISQDSQQVKIDVLDERVFIGTITRTQFNIIYIQVNKESEFQPDTEFGIYKSKLSENEISSGIITASDGEILTGRIVSISDTSQKPEAGDFIYLK